MTQQQNQVLLHCGLFRGMDAGTARGLLDCLAPEVVSYERQAVIYHVGQPVTSCALVLSGAVRAEAVNAAGERALVVYHGPGALVGDVLMATPGGKSPVYVLAAEPVTVAFFSYHKIMGGCSRCCDAHSRLRENLMAEIAEKYWAQRRRLGYLSVPSLRRRIAMYLLDRRQGSDTITLGLTREALADLLCVNRSALSRELGRMKQEGLIDFYRDTFRLLDTEGLGNL